MRPIAALCGVWVCAVTLCSDTCRCLKRHWFMKGLCPMTNSSPINNNAFYTPSNAPSSKYPSGYFVRVDHGNLTDSLLIIDMSTGQSPVPEACKTRVSVPKSLSSGLRKRAGEIVAGIQSGVSRKGIEHSIATLLNWVKDERSRIAAAMERQAQLPADDKQVITDLTQPPTDHTIEDGLFRATGAGPTDTPSPADFRDGQPTVIYGTSKQDFKHSMKEILNMIVVEQNEERRRELMKKLEHATA